MEDLRIYCTIVAPKKSRHHTAYFRWADLNCSICLFVCANTGVKLTFDFRMEFMTKPRETKYQKSTRSIKV